ncbi:8-amino-7-oxononanoate synthase [Halomonas denitrificans]|nr:8-amino-7-oxononanoate synthase [Halomonas denitrificans]
MRGRLDATLAARRTEREAAGRRRVVQAFEPIGGCRVRHGDVELIDFCSNDYLGLARERAPGGPGPDVDGGSPTGSAASPLVSGYGPGHLRLAARLAEFVGAEAAVLVPSGYQANLALGQALLGRGDAVLADRLNHASLNDGARLAGARIRRYAHADGDDAQRRLDARTRWLASDAVFSMDGDVAPLSALAALADRSGLGLWIDDAHGFGVLGPGGRGAVADSGVRADALVITFGKALGTQGAAILGERALIDELVNGARAIIYSTAPSPLLVDATDRALTRLQQESWRRTRLREAVERFRAGCERAGVPLGPSTTPIQPVLLGDDRSAVRAADALAARGFLVRAIRPPTVPEGRARLRITLSSAHENTAIDGLVAALAEALPQASSRVEPVATATTTATPDGSR